MSEIKWFLLLLAAGFLILLFRHIQLKKQIRNLSGQVKEWNRGNSGQMIDISLMDKDLEHLAAILNLYNIGQRQAVAKTLRHEEHLKESVANISHDLRTPLTVILGHLQLLQKEDLEPAQAKRIAVVLRKAEKMKELVEAFYDLSVLEEQQTVPSKVTFNFSNMLIDLITEHAPALEKKEYHTGNKTAGLFHLYIFRPEYGRADFAKPADKCNEVFGREHKNNTYAEIGWRYPVYDGKSSE